MKADEIKVGGLYEVKVGGEYTTVRVDRIRPDTGKFIKNKGEARFDCTVLRSGAKVEYRSAAKFRSAVPESKPEGEQSLPPTQNSTVTSPQTSDITSVEDDARSVSPQSEETSEVSTPAQSVDTTGATGAAQTSDRTKEGEHRLDPTPPDASPVVGAGPASSRLASRIASASTGRQRGTPVAGMVPNEEQEEIIATALRLFKDVKVLNVGGQVVNVGGQVVLVVMAGAGSGKTATCKMLEELLQGRGQYTAFNRPLVDEARPKFKRAKCSTTHQLAFHAVGKQFAHRLNGERIRSWEVARILGIQPISLVLKGMGAPDKDGRATDKVKVLQPDYLAGQIQVAIKKFCQSADLEIGEHHFHYIDGIDVPDDGDDFPGPPTHGRRGWKNNNIVRKEILPFARKMWEDLSKVDGVLPFSHDCYVKIWQLGQGDDRPIIASDYILLDEYQDTAPVFLDVLARQRHALLIMVGDDNQRIYEWRGAVNAGDHFPEAPRCMLSQSYRFGQVIADVANAVLETLEEPTKLRMRGNPALPSRVGTLGQAKCYLYRTNAGAIGRVMQGIEEGKHPHLVFGTEDAKRQLVSFFDGVLDLQAKPPRKTKNSELACFDSWDEVVEYAGTDEGADLKLMVKLVNEFGAEAIRDALKNMPKEEDADFVCSTAHRSKGREWDTVKLGPDFPLANKMTDSDRRLLYVAVTRAKLTLDISDCPPFCGGNDSRDTGNPERAGAWVPGLEVEYTVEMPTQEEQDAWITAGRTLLKKEDVPTEPRPVAAPTAEQVKRMFQAKDDAQAQQDIAKAKSSTSNGCFTWTKFDGGWFVRGPVGTPVNTRVTVSRKNGSTSTVTLRVVKHKFPDAWIYGL